jgi:hypothetical protein
LGGKTTTSWEALMKEALARLLIATDLCCLRTVRQGSFQCTL